MVGNLIRHIYDSGNTTETMNKLKKYTRGCSYLTQSESKKRIQMYIDCNCDYRKTAEMLDGVSEKALRSAVSYANDALKKAVGEEIVEQIENADPIAGLIIDLASTSTKSPVLIEAWSAVPEYRHRGFDINDCRRELAYFGVYSHSCLKYCFDRCDMDKLAYIKHLLESPSNIERRESLVLHEWLNKVGNLNKDKISAILDTINNLDN